MNAHRTPGPTSYGALVPAPVRRWLYGIAAAALAVAAGYGLMTETETVLWLNLAGSVLFTMAVGNTPTRPAEQAPGEPE